MEKPKVTEITLTAEQSKKFLSFFVDDVIRLLKERQVEECSK